MPKNTFTRLFEQVIRQYLRFAIRKSRFVVGFVAVIAIFAISWLVIARPLRLDTDLASLLPKDLPCVTESSRISERVGSIDLLVVAIQSPRPDDNIDFSNEILEKIKSLPDITWAANREDKSYFRDHRLLYLETEDLREIVSRVEKRAAYEKKFLIPSMSLWKMSHLRASIFPIFCVGTRIASSGWERTAWMKSQMTPAGSTTRTTLHLPREILLRSSRGQENSLLISTLPNTWLREWKNSSRRRILIETAICASR